jgi:anti-sigma-K factor RskA
MSTHPSDAAAYLLGELDAEQRAAFEAALAADPALRAEVERLRPVVGRLDALPGEAWEDVEPPPLAVPPSPAAAPRERRRRRLVLRPVFAALAAAALLAGGVAIGIAVDDGGGSSAPVVARAPLPLAPLGEGAAHGRALVADAGTRPHVTLRLGGLPRSRAGEFYEVWLMDADGPLIALGSFRVGADGRATVRLPLPVPATDYQYFDISVQPEGDDAGHSGDSVLRGPTSA